MKPKKQIRSNRPARRAFTLIEIIVVVTIIALLAAVIAPRLFGRIDWAKDNAAKADVKSIADAVKMYLMDTEQTLNDGFELRDLIIAAEDGGGLNGPYLKKDDDLFDPWHNAFVILVPGDVNHDFDIISIGRDGQFGTEDDITN